jgi:amidase
LRQAGAFVVDVKFPDIPQTFVADRMALMQFEFKANLNKYLADRGGQYKTLQDLIKFNLENKDKELSKFGQELFTESQARADLTDKSYLEAVARLQRQTRKDGIDTVLTQNKLDALVSPFGELVGVAAIAGYPSILVPLGFRNVPAVPASGNLPASSAFTRTTGMLFVGTAWSEPTLIKYAFAFEQLTKGRVTPQFLATAPKTS